jgi:hypothetical protein
VILLITGTREVYNPREVEKAVQWMTGVHKEFRREDISFLVHGAARGIDISGRDWAIGRGIHHEPFPADWDRFGKRAGHYRNEEMANFCLSCNEPTWVLAFPHKTLPSRGTRDMIEVCDERHMHITEFLVPSEE